LGGIIVLLLAWGFYLKMYGVLYSTQGPAFGASYTDVHVKVPAYKGMIIVSLGLAVVLFLNVFKPRTKLIWIGVGIWTGAVLVFASLLHVLVQKFSDKTRAVALPELKRVIVAYGNRVIMEETLNKALSRALQAVTLPKESASSIKASAQDMNDTGKAALEYYLKDKDYLREGNWTEYGKALENMEKILMKIFGTPEQAEQPQFQFKTGKAAR